MHYVARKKFCRGNNRIKQVGKQIVKAFRARRGLFFGWKLWGQRSRGSRLLFAKLGVEIAGGKSKRALLRYVTFGWGNGMTKQ